MAPEIPQAGLELHEDYAESLDHLPTQAFIVDLDDDVIEGMIESAKQGHEIRLSLGNKPTFIFGSSNHHVEPTFEDETDDIELFLSDAVDPTKKAERLPQPAMSLFRKPDLENTWSMHRTSSDEEEDEEEEEYDEEYDEDVYLSDAEDDDQQANDEDLDTDIAQLRNSLAQSEAEKQGNATKVLGPVPTLNGRGKRGGGSFQKPLPSRRSPFGRSSLSPLPGSPSLNAIGSPSLDQSDITSQQTMEKAKQARSPIIHELAFKEQPYDILWQKYPGPSEAEFKTALEKVAYPDDDTHNYVLRKKYWKELDVWNHEYASDDERQQAIDNAIRTFDKMRISTSDPEWERLLPFDERGQGKILSKIQVSIAKGPAPRIRVQKTDDSSQDSGSGSGSNRGDSGDNGSGSRRDEDGTVTGKPAATKKKTSAREAQEKRLLSTKRKAPAAPTPKVSPTKANPKTSNEKPSKFKSKEFITDSDSSDSELESVPLSSSVHTKLSAASSKATAAVKSAAKALSASPRPGDRTPQEVINAAPARPSRPSPAKEAASKPKPKPAPKPLPKKRPREYEDDDSSGSSSSSGAPLSKRIKPTKALPKPVMTKDREKVRQQQQQQQQQQQSSRQQQSSHSHASETSPNSSSGSSGGGGSGSNRANGASSRPRPNTSPVKSSPLASSPPTNASEIDLSSEESVPPISSGVSKNRRMDDRRNGYDASTNSKILKRRHLSNDLVDKALRFKVYYEKYAALYKDISSRSNPPANKVEDLLEMHKRLQEMKNSIHREAMARS